MTEEEFAAELDRLISSDEIVLDLISRIELLEEERKSFKADHDRLQASLHDPIKAAKQNVAVVSRSIAIYGLEANKKGREMMALKEELDARVEEIAVNFLAKLQGSNMDR